MNNTIKPSQDKTVEKKKIITELRVYPNMESLRRDFEKQVQRAESYDCKIIPNQEIYISNVIRLVFKVDRPENVRGYRPDKIFIDEMVSQETIDYLNLVTPNE